VSATLKELAVRAELFALVPIATTPEYSWQISEAVVEPLRFTVILDDELWHERMYQISTVQVPETLRATNVAVSPVPAFVVTLETVTEPLLIVIAATSVFPAVGVKTPLTIWLLPDTVPEY
jgi:hypothetical protein